MVIPNWWEVKENQYQDSRVNLYDGLNSKLFYVVHRILASFGIIHARPNYLMPSKRFSSHNICIHRSDLPNLQRKLSLKYNPYNQLPFGKQHTTIIFGMMNNNKYCHMNSILLSILNSKIKNYLTKKPF